MFMNSIKLNLPKALLIALFACCTSYCIGQKAGTKKRVKHGYAEIDFVAGFSSNSNNSFGGSINFGVKPSKKLSTGLGFEALKFKQMTTLYVPVYLDLRYALASSKAVEAFVVAQPGYGFFSFKDDQIDTALNTSNAGSSIQQKGGFCFSGGIGIKGKSKPAPVLSLCYGFYQLKTTLNGDIFKAKNIGNINSWMLNIGIAF